MKATYVRHLHEWSNANLYEVNPPVPYTKVRGGDFVELRTRWVISSTALHREGQTLIFPANEAGEVMSWREIAGGGGMNHEDAILDLLTRNPQEVPE